LNDYSKVNKFQVYVTLAILILINAILAAIRPMSIPDTVAYYDVYKGSTGYLKTYKFDNVLDLFANRSFYSIEIGFVYISSIFSRLNIPFRVFLFIVCILNSLLLVRGMNICTNYLCKKENVKDNRHLITIWSYYIAGFGMHYSSVAIRSGLAIGLSICFVGHFLTKNKRIIGLIEFALALSIHTTSITYVLIILLMKYGPSKFTLKKYVLIWLTMVASYALNVGKYTVSCAIYVLEWVLKILNIHAFGSYIDQSVLTFEFAKASLFWVFMLGLVVLFAYCDTEMFSKISFVVTTGIVIFVLARPIEAVSRECDLFVIFVILLLVYKKMISNRNNGKVHMAQISMIVFFLTQFNLLYRRFW
jgi:hypothetical protein